MSAGLIERFYELAAAGDAEAMRDCLDPEVVWLGTRGGLDEDQVVRGPDAVLAYMREIETTWQRLSVEIERTVERGDTVVAFLRETGRARHGGPEVETRTALVVRVREGRMLEIRGYLDRDEAMRAASAR